MPVTVEERGGKQRIVEGKGGPIAKNSAGNPVDGGGHPNKVAAESQAKAINASLKKQGKI